MAGKALCGNTEEAVDELTLAEDIALAQPADLSFPDCVHRFIIGEPKTVDSYGYVSLPAKLESELRTWVHDEAIAPEGWIFSASRGGGPIRPNNYVKRDLAKLAEAAGVGHIDLRRLRRTCATYLRDEATAQGQLRHSSVETTKRHYLKAIPAEQKARVEKLDKELFGPAKLEQVPQRKHSASPKLLGKLLGKK